MAFPRRHNFHKRRPDHPRQHQDHPRQHQEVSDLVHPEHTGSESAYLKSLVDSHSKVTVVLTSGERLHGVIRYYDRDCFSVGLSSEGPRIFLRKASVSYIAED
jgi:sRNA-binding regulator protein Hfq